jgi:UDPglucose 6-dehydrogenase
MNITIIGTGYVGLVTGACLADLGHTVTCLDVDEDKIRRLQEGEVPIFEPGLEELIERNVGADRMQFMSNYDAAIPEASVVLVAVGTPSLPSGDADLSQVEAAVARMAPLLSDRTTVVMKSTVPVGTTERILSKLLRNAAEGSISFGSNPEFLKQGTAVQDFLHPDRLVIGTHDEQAERALKAVYQPLLSQGAPAVFTDIATAELIKYASNAFLAVKLSFINEMADLCEQTGASISDVSVGMGMDQRISDSFLKAGPGYGGSCFPKDTQALLHTSQISGTPSRIVASAIDVNRNRRAQMVERITRIVGGNMGDKQIAILGLTFKAHTDDLRESPAIEVTRGLLGLGASVSVYDPQGMERARSVLSGPRFAVDPYDAIEGADAVVIVTEWPEFASLDLGRVRGLLARPTIIDLRNLYEPAEVEAAGIAYHSIGRARVDTAGRTD